MKLYTACLFLMTLLTVNYSNALGERMVLRRRETTVTIDPKKDAAYNEKVNEKMRVNLEQDNRPLLPAACCCIGINILGGLAVQGFIQGAELLIKKTV